MSDTKKIVPVKAGTLRGPGCLTVSLSKQQPALSEPKLRDLALQFRKALERCSSLAPAISLAAFPRGSCGDACLLLARFLKEKGFGTADYVCGEREDHSHAWLELDDIIIDITADQFPDAPGPVIVTRVNAWHSRFNEIDRYPAELRETGDSDLKGTYALILAACEAEATEQGMLEPPMRDGKLSPGKTRVDLKNPSAPQIRQPAPGTQQKNTKALLTAASQRGPFLDQCMVYGDCFRPVFLKAILEYFICNADASELRVIRAAVARRAKQLPVRHRGRPQAIEDEQFLQLAFKQAWQKIILGWTWAEIAQSAGLEPTKENNRTLQRRRNAYADAIWSELPWYPDGGLEDLLQDPSVQRLLRFKLGMPFDSHPKECATIVLELLRNWRGPHL